MREDRSVGELERGDLGVAGGVAKSISRALAQEWNRTAVNGDDLFVFDPSRAKRLLYASTRVNPRPTIIPVTNEQCRNLGAHVLLLPSGFSEVAIY